ncbi:YhbY family RNA-binding protein [Candidatus Pacearchaeota archaeon]|nr:YhbY family RNA-binding protein [Candidatus Pacearchaeota archaeon]
MPVANIQLGKQGLTENFLKTLQDHFKKFENVKVSVLKSCCRDRKELKKISEEILEKLGKNYTTRNIGYTIVLKRWRKVRG